jgi:hypothetical protein
MFFVIEGVHDIYILSREEYLADETITNSQIHGKNSPFELLVEAEIYAKELAETTGKQRYRPFDRVGMNITLLSTVVAPSFEAGLLSVTPVEPAELPGLLPQVTRNLCGHPVTNGVLQEVYPDLPAPEKAFWTGDTVGLAARPKGGVRGASQEGDTKVTLDDLEFALVRYVKPGELNPDNLWREGCALRGLTGDTHGFGYNSAEFYAKDREGNRVYSEMVGA